MSRSTFPGFDTPLQATRKVMQKRHPHKHSEILNETRSHGTSTGSQNDGFPLFNNRSLSLLSTVHHLNPHRKVAMSPEILREAEEQATSLRKTVTQLQEQLDRTSREKARVHRFLSDLLYTLNARGYESIRDHEGTLVDLNKCKGEAYLDLRGRDLKQKVNVRRQGGHEFLLKAIIGNQERAIQNLIHKLESLGRDIVLGNRLNTEVPRFIPASHEASKVACLEAEVLQLVNLIEGACQKCPEMYSALRDYYYLNESTEGSELSPRNPILQNLLKKCEQIVNDTQAKQLVEMLDGRTKIRPKTDGSMKAPRAKTGSKGRRGQMRSVTSAESITTGLPPRSRPDTKESYNAHLKVNSRSDSFLYK